MRVKVKCQRTIYYDDEVDLDEKALAYIKETYGEVNQDTIEHYFMYEYPLDDDAITDEMYEFDVKIDGE